MDESRCENNGASKLPNRLIGSEESAGTVTGQRPSVEQDQGTFGLVDTIGLVVGIVVGTAIFKLPPAIFQFTGSTAAAIGMWIVGGMLAISGAWCYVELATTYPLSGGEYQYLRLAYGRPLSFLFGWSQLTVILTGSVGAMAYTFADYAAVLWSPVRSGIPWVAVMAVIVLAILNQCGLNTGRKIQGIFSAAKIAGLSGVALTGLFAAPTGAANSLTPTAPSGVSLSQWGLALVFVMYAYGGWNDTSFIAAEVRARTRNLPRALMWGILLILVLYVGVNWAYVRVLGYGRLTQSTAPAADVLAVALGPIGANILAVLVMISALGAVNGLLLTGSRVHAALGHDYPLLRWLNSWNVDRHVPTWALWLQSAITCALILLVGTETGQWLADRPFVILGFPSLPWKSGSFQGGFELLLAATAPVFWAFALLTTLSAVVLRRHHPDKPRPCAMPLYPLPCILFAMACAYMLVSSILYAKSLALLGVGLLLCGLPVYCWHGTVKT